MLECKLSRPDAKVTWYKDGKELIPDDGHEIIVDKSWRRLKIPACVLDDEAEYSVVVGDETSRAMLWVEGTCLGSLGNRAAYALSATLS